MSDSFDDRLDQWLVDLDGNDFVVGIEAAKFLEHERETNPAELDEWLHERAAAIITERMRLALRSRRATGLRRQASRTFADAVESGDPERLVTYLDVPYVIDDSGTQRPLGRMTWTDVDWVAAAYEGRATSNAFEAAFLRAVQRRLPRDGSRAVGDVFTIEQLDRLRKRAA